MKKIILLLLFVFLQNAYPQWELCNIPVTPYNPVSGLTSLLAFDNYIIAGAYEGIYVSTDYGETWSTKKTGIPRTIRINCLAKSGNYILAGTDIGIYATTDFGNTWIFQNTGIPKNYHIRSILVNDKNIYAAGTGIYLSTDNGDNWTTKATYLPCDGHSALDDYLSLAMNEKNLYVAAMGGIFLSTDNGDTWIDKGKGINYETITSLAFNNNNIYAGVPSYGVYMSTDNGDD